VLLLKTKTFIDLFAGIGGFHFGLSKLGMECVFASELDKHARWAYLQNHNIDEAIFNNDIRSINEEDIADHDILCAGFPCQPFSQSGHKKGFNDGEKSERGNLFFCILSVLEVKRPKAFILENVRHLLKHDDGKTFSTIEKYLREIGYSVTYKVIKATDFGRPQHRPRVYIVGFDTEQIDTSFEYFFPEPIPLEMNMSDIWGGRCEREIGFTLRVGGRGSPINDRRNWDSYRVDGEVKRLGPVEGRKMMGYPDSFILPKSATQAMKLLGNSVCVDVVENIGKSVLEYISKYDFYNNDSKQQLNGNFMPLKFSKGEWGEIYTFFKIISNNKIHFSDKNKKKLEEYITVLEVSHNHSDKIYQLLNSRVSIRDNSGTVFIESSVHELISNDELQKLLENIKNGKGRSFEIDEVSALLEIFLVKKFKGNSKDKHDISISFQHNGVSYNKDPLGIKSWIGSPPTLLNPGAATNFIFEILNFNGNIDAINQITSNTPDASGKKITAYVRARINKIFDDGAELSFFKCEKPVYENNLRLIDSKMPEILSEMLVLYYTGNGSKVLGLLRDKQKQQRMKDYLKAILLGMFSSKEWDGNYTSNGTISTAKDGELTLFHVLKDDVLKDYLIKNTKLDTPSASRYRFANVFKEDGKYYIKLNLQIRMF
jgi:DNA (cytosine-5)-methyltransferase 1